MSYIQRNIYVTIIMENLGFVSDDLGFTRDEFKKMKIEHRIMLVSSSFDDVLDRRCDNKWKLCLENIYTSINDSNKEDITAIGVSYGYIYACALHDFFTDGQNLFEISQFARLTALKLYNTHVIANGEHNKIKFNNV
jgi:hypothetical protein